MLRYSIESSARAPNGPVRVRHGPPRSLILTHDQFPLTPTRRGCCARGTWGPSGPGPRARRTYRNDVSRQSRTWESAHRALRTVRRGSGPTGRAP
ncbi:hypothetical protein GS506_07760 [Rhodococcus hoagii]|nr:hypothetical protein [Prescottella equi]